MLCEMRLHNTIPLDTQVYGLHCGYRHAISIECHACRCVNTVAKLEQIVLLYAHHQQGLTTKHGVTEIMDNNVRVGYNSHTYEKFEPRIEFCQLHGMLLSILYALLCNILLLDDHVF